MIKGKPQCSEVAFERLTALGSARQNMDCTGTDILSEIDRILNVALCLIGECWNRRAAHRITYANIEANDWQSFFSQ